MRGTIEVTNYPEERTVRVRLSGKLGLAHLREFARRYDEIATFYDGRPHVILADVRGMEPLAGDAAAVLAETIELSRRSGCKRCAHLSDETVQRLQTARLARQASPMNDVTVDVVSLEEAERLLAETRATFDAP